MDRYRREHHRPNPSWHEVLGVLGSLGYRRVAGPVGRTTGVSFRGAEAPAGDEGGPAEYSPSPN